MAHQNGSLAIAPEISSNTEVPTPLSSPANIKTQELIKGDPACVIDVNLASLLNFQYTVLQQNSSIHGSLSVLSGTI